MLKRKQINLARALFEPVLEWIMETTKTRQQSILTFAVKMFPHSFMHHPSPPTKKISLLKDSNRKTIFQNFHVSFKRLDTLQDEVTTLQVLFLCHTCVLWHGRLVKMNRTGMKFEIQHVQWMINYAIRAICIRMFE